MTDARIMALRLAQKVCPFLEAPTQQVFQEEMAGVYGIPLHRSGDACPCCAKIADVLEEYAKEQTIDLHTEIRDLKDVGRAKAQMVAGMGYTEASAHRYLQKTAMATRRSMGELARDILKETAQEKRVKP